MRSSTWFERANTVAQGLRRKAEDDARTRLSRDELLSYQRTELNRLVHHATAHSPFYRELYGDVVRGDVELQQLPTVSKAAMMEHYDRFVTDRRLRRDALLAHAATVQGDELWQDEFRVMVSSGSSGPKALYAYDQTAWRGGFTTAGLRMTSMAGLRPKLPRPRMVTIAAGDGKHMTFRGGASIDVGLYRTARLSASAPLGELVAALQRFQPDFVLGYPSVLACLAHEQRAGRLQIAPVSVVTSSEVCTPAMRESIRAAWNIEPFNCLGLTETGITAIDCEAHNGLHVFEDLSIIEVVDAHHKPVPAGRPGAKILVTNLYNRCQPIIRFEVSDLVTLDDRPCSCGRSLQRIVALDGRSDDILDLPGPAGRITLHPIHVRSILGKDTTVIQYQVTSNGETLDVEVVLGAGASSDTVQHLTSQLLSELRGRGAELPVRVRSVAAIAREEGPGKLKLVRVLK
jgi:phenylacetate-coenzyme A ligase PaaK-like adenylate-forming protein